VFDSAVGGDDSYDSDTDADDNRDRARHKQRCASGVTPNAQISAPPPVC
jgi:hypothetical protein